jgi:hypothetical protein
MRLPLFPNHPPTHHTNVMDECLIQGQYKIVVYYRKSYIFWCVEINNSGLHHHFK